MVFWLIFFSIAILIILVVYRLLAAKKKYENPTFNTLLAT